MNADQEVVWKHNLSMGITVIAAPGERVIKINDPGSVLDAERELLQYVAGTSPEIW